MYQWGLNFCPDYPHCEEPTSGLDYNEYFDCGDDDCNEVSEWGFVNEKGDFCEHYNDIDEYYLEFCEDSTIMLEFELDYCPNWVEDVYTCEESTSGVNYDDYFNCSTASSQYSCNDIDNWGSFYEKGDFCSYYTSIDEFWMELCDDEDFVEQKSLDYCPNF